MMKSSLNHKDILMTKTGRINTENSSLGRAALFLGNDNTANVNGHVYLIRLQNTQVHEFVVHILTTKEYRGLIRDICVGGIDKRQLNKDHIEDFPIIYPPLVTQQKFADLLSFIKKQKQRSEVSAKKSEAIFSTLIQKAFKGELEYARYLPASPAQLITPNACTDLSPNTKRSSKAACCTAADPFVTVMPSRPDAVAAKLLADDCVAANADDDAGVKLRGDVWRRMERARRMVTR